MKVNVIARLQFELQYYFQALYRLRHEDSFQINKYKYTYIYTVMYFLWCTFLSDVYFGGKNLWNYSKIHESGNYFHFPSTEIIE